MNKDKSTLYIILTGWVMGMAEVIPGVSGGTVAFVAGIYETLLTSIANLRKLPSLILSGQWRKVFTEINAPFLIKLALGMIIGIGIGVVVITRFLESHPPVVWSLFFGLVIASVVYMAEKVKWSRWILLVFALMGALLAIYIGSLQMGGGSTTMIFVFVSGMLAIVALVLPGISGSFILLMLGMYTFIVRDTLKGLAVDFSSDKLMTLVIFALGCITGLLSISRLLQWAFAKYRSETIATLTGFMLGALPQIWPWRQTKLWMDKESGQIVDHLPVGEYKVLDEVLISPLSYSGESFLFPSMVAMMIGFGLVFMFWRYEKRN